MLAEEIFSIDTVLPEALQSTAVIFGEELAWPPDDALRVIEWLSSHDFAVAGVELWRNSNGKPLWLATSSYADGIENLPSPTSVAECGHQAKHFVCEFRQYQNRSDNLFNLTWVPNTASMSSGAFHP